MRLHPLLPAAGALLALLPAAAPAAAPVRYFGHPKGDRSAITEFRTTAGCIDRDTFIWPVHHVDGTNQADVEVVEYDHCADQLLLDHVAIADQPDLLIATDLTSASLEETIPLFDALDESFPQIGSIAVDLTWRASGPLYRDNILYNNGHSGSVTLVNHDHELCRDATVSGTLEGTDVGDVVASRICRQIGGSLFLYIE